MRVGERGLYVYMCHVYISEWNWDMNGYDSPGISKRASNTSTFLQIFVASDTALNAGQLRRLGPPVDKGSRPGWYCKKNLLSLEKKFTFPGKNIYSPWKRNLGSSGPVVLWLFGPFILWSSGCLVLWSCGPLVLWSSGPLVLRFSGPVFV